MATQELLVHQLDLSLRNLRHQTPSLPRQGWLRAVRMAWGMTSGQLAKRLNTSQSSVIEYEKREAAGTITLATLRRVAAAKECDLVYALVPRRPLGDIVRNQAEFVARRKLEPVALSMKLEDQAISADAMERQVQELARKLIAGRRGELWR